MINPRRTIRNISIILLLLCFLVGCSLDGSTAGSVRISFAENADSRVLNTEPIDMHISTYVITLSRTGVEPITLIHEKSSGNDIAVDALTAGVWELTIAGKNSSGTVIAELSDGTLPVTVRRGVITSVAPIMVPLSGQGTLAVSCALSGDSEVIADPHQLVTIRDTDGTVVQQSSLRTDETLEIFLDAGWYQVEIMLHDGDPAVSSVVYGRKLLFPRIVSAQVTQITALFTVGTYAVGEVGPAGGVIAYEFPSHTAIDAAGYHDGTIYGATRETIDGQSGLYFSNDAYVELQSAVDTVPQVFEARIWVSEDHLSTERVGIIAGNYADGADNTHTIGWEIYTDGQPRLWWDGGVIDFRFNYDVRTSSWVYLRFERQGDGFHLFVDDTTADGSTVREIPATYEKGFGAGNDVNLTAVARNLRIGSDYPNTRQPFDGYIADVSITGADGTIAFNFPFDRWIEVAPYDVRVLSDGSVSCDITESDYSLAAETYIGGYYRESDGVPNTIAGTIGRVGSGKLNTRRLVTAMGDHAYSSSTGAATTGNYAARLADELTYRGFSDWYLPSIDEWEQITLAVHTARLGNFSEQLYWSSTESSGETMEAYQVTGDFPISAGRDQGLLIRPVRAF